jgi:hypothetical protein
MTRIINIALIAAFCSVTAAGQLSLPRESQRQETTQVVGDAKITIVYHRPNVKGRKIWGELVPYGKIWRTGANENTTVEISRDAMINGQPLPAGKYGMHTVPTANEWTVVFNNVNNEWGSFTYDEKKDALRVKAVPQPAPMQETMSIDIDNVTARSADISIEWEKLRVPITVDFGDVAGRNLTMIREAVKSRKPDDVRPLTQGAGYVYSLRLKDNYDEAIGWLDQAIAVKEAFGPLSTKARILAEMGRTADAVAVGEKAVAVGKAATPAVNTADFEAALAGWKTKK